MTVLPGSLDHLYYNGILDSIPYEAYEMPPVARPRINPGSRTISYQAPSLRQEILAEANKTEKINKPNKSYIWKGLIGLGVIIATLVCLAKRSSGFWKKLNPKNW